MVEPGVVALTGASGFIGGVLATRLQGAGWQVRLLGRSPDGVDLDGGERVSWSLGEPAARGLQGARVLIHAAVAHLDRQPDASRLNVEGSLRLLADARAAGVAQSVFLSSMSAHGHATSAYGLDKLRVQDAWTGPDAIALRPGLVLGHGGLFGRLHDLVARRRLLPVVGADRQLQTVHVDDLASAIGVVIDRRLSGVLTVAERVPVRFGDLLRTIVTLQGSPTVLVPVPFGVASAGFRVARWLRLRLPVSEENLAGLAALRTEDVSRDLERLGVRIRSYRASLEAIMGQEHVGGQQADGLA